MSGEASEDECGVSVKVSSEQILLTSLVPPRDLPRLGSVKGPFTPLDTNNDDDGFVFSSRPLI